MNEAFDVLREEEWYRKVEKELFENAEKGFDRRMPKTSGS